MRFLNAFGLATLLCAPHGDACSQSLSLPPRAVGALTGTQFADAVAKLPWREREERLHTELTRGNVPAFLRTLSAVSVTNVAGGRTNRATFFVTPDYLAVGSDADYFLAPMTPQLAQRLADELDCSLPTRAMVDAVHAAAAVKLTPAPIPPSAAMTTVRVFVEHNATVRRQRDAEQARHPPGALVAGHKKDMVLTPRLTNAPGRVAIYGWHRPDGPPIQPLHLGHTNSWVDYSHGVRLVSQDVLVNGERRRLAGVLADPELAGLLSDEGPLTHPRYALGPQVGQDTVAAANETSRAGLLPGFNASAHFGEQTCSFTVEPDVKVHVNAPSAAPFAAGKPVKLVLYALPNGNTTAQTIGRQLRPADDWHFDIQHIGAQTRFVRERRRDETLVVAYLETAARSWPAWRQKHGHGPIRAVVDAVKGRLAEGHVRLVLSGHSGGGSFLFGYLDAAERIPDEVERLVFLDSNYGYDAARGHAEKLARWLKASAERHLAVFAYDDSAALLDGKPVVSATGGTWRRSLTMQKDLAAEFEFRSNEDTDFLSHTALNGQVRFLLRKNPERRILHTVQVERNGFIHSLLLGTPQESAGYAYFGPRAYTRLIQTD